MLSFVERQKPAHSNHPKVAATGVPPLASGHDSHPNTNEPFNRHLADRKVEAPFPPEAPWRPYRHSFNESMLPVYENPAVPVATPKIRHGSPIAL